jgi:hypothetical protein
VRDLDCFKRSTWSLGLCDASLGSLNSRVPIDMRKGASFDGAISTG